MTSATPEISRQLANGIPEPDIGDLADAGEHPAGYLTADFFLGLARLPFVGAAIRRRIRFWCATAVAGLAVGGALYVVHPPAYKASTSVLVTQDPALNPMDAVQTDVALAQSRSVAGPVMRELGLTGNVTKFVGSYTVAAVTDRVLVITVSAPTSAQAVRQAAALATAFLTFRAHELRAAQQRVVSSLSASISKAKQQIAATDQQIPSTHGQSSARSSALARSSATRSQPSPPPAGNSQADTALAALEQAEASYSTSSQVTIASMIAGSRVLDAAAPLPRSKLRSPVVYPVAGALAGLLTGMAIVTIGELVSDRLRRRDDVAIALDAPVELSAGSPPRRWPRRRGQAARALAGHDRDIAWIVRYLRRAIDQARAGDVAALAVVALGKPRVAALSVASLATSLAQDGQRVLVADLAPGAPAARMLGVRAPGVVTATVAGQQLTVAVPDHADLAPTGPVEHSATRTAEHPLAPTGPVEHPPNRTAERSVGWAAEHAGTDPAGQPRAGAGEPELLAAAYRDSDVLVSLMTLDPAQGSKHLPTWAAGAVVMLTAGASSRTQVRTTGEMIGLAGTPLISAILLDADKTDESLGMLTFPLASGAL